MLSLLIFQILTIGSIHAQLTVPPTVILPTSLSWKQVDKTYSYNKRDVNKTVPIIIIFNYTGPSITNYTWSINGTVTNTITVSSPGVSYTPLNSSQITLNISSFDETYAGWNYTLSVGSGPRNSATVNIVSPPILPSFSASLRFTQGDNYNLTVTMNGFPASNLSFSCVTPCTDTALPTGCSLLGNGMLTFNSNIALTPRGFYLFAVNATNSYGTDTTLIKVRVKDRLAALWPFIGILIEAVILLIVILLYEKHKAKRRKEMAADIQALAVEPAGDFSDPQNTRNNGDDVRQRPVKA